MAPLPGLDQLQRRPQQLWVWNWAPPRCAGETLAGKLPFPWVLVIRPTATSVRPFVSWITLPVLIAVVGTVGTEVSVTRPGRAEWLVHVAVLPQPPWRISPETFFGGWLG